MQPIVVHKYGGSSLGDVAKIRAVAQRIADTVADGLRVVAVVSAMAGKTDSLLAHAKALSDNPTPRELDMLLSVGERISTASVAIALDELGVPAVSFTGSQAGIITNARHNRARIVEVRPFRVMDELDAGKVVIVAGYQGVSYSREITTLGRGGTDTTAVALAAALGAEHCEILSDVDGVYTADPRVVPEARRLPTVGYDEMVALARHGAKVLNQDCVQYASRHGIAVFAKATFGPRDDTGTLVRTNPVDEPTPVRAIAHRRELVRVHLPSERLPRALAVLTALGIFPSGAEGGRDGASVALDLPLEDAHRQGLLAAHLTRELAGQARLERGLGSVTVVGHGLGDEPDVLASALAGAQAVGAGAPGVRLGPLELTLTVPSEAVVPLVTRLHATLLDGVVAR